jgi:hypothetical protein
MDVSRGRKWFVCSGTPTSSHPRKLKTGKLLSRHLKHIRKFVAKTIMADHRGYAQNGTDDWGTFDYSTMSYQPSGTGTGASSPKSNRLVKKYSM